MMQLRELDGLGGAEHLEKLRREAATRRYIDNAMGAGRAPQRGPTGMRGFLLVWLGQAASYLGSSIVTFGLTIWAW